MVIRGHSYVVLVKIRRACKGRHVWLLHQNSFVRTGSIHSFNSSNLQEWMLVLLKNDSYFLLFYILPILTIVLKYDCLFVNVCPYFSKCLLFIDQSRQNIR